MYWLWLGYFFTGQNACKHFPFAVNVMVNLKVVHIQNILLQLTWVFCSFSKHCLKSFDFFLLLISYFLCRKYRLKVYNMADIAIRNNYSDWHIFIDLSIYQCMFTTWCLTRKKTKVGQVIQWSCTCKLKLHSYWRKDGAMLTYMCKWY